MAERIGFLNALCGWLFPPKCTACGKLLDPDRPDEWGKPFCAACRTEWENEQAEVCGICQKPVPQCTCATPLMQAAKCEPFFKLAYYRSGKKTLVQNRVIFRLKRRRDRILPAFFAEELTDAIRQAEILPDCIAYVPRSRKSVLETGNDQAKELAKALSALLGVPVVPALVHTRGENREQKQFEGTARLKNAKQAYRPAKKMPPVKGKKILLVDDIVTTGASMATCARILRRAGASAIFAAAIATDDVNREPQTGENEKISQKH